MLCLKSILGKAVFLLSISVCCFLMGSILLIFNGQLFNIIINSQVQIKEGTAAYNAWVETTIPMYTKFYFFDMMNPSDLFHKHEKPILDERGPYTFREVQKKVNLTWHEDGTVTYQRRKFWYFEREMSVGPLTDMVTTINVPVIGAADFAKGDYMMEWGISDMLSTLEAEIFVRKSVGQLLFEGYEDVVMELGTSMTNEDDYTEEDFFGEEYESDEENVDPVEDSLQDKFGWFYKRNGTSWSDGFVKMHTGSGDISKLGEILEWNNANRVDAFPGECGKIKGSSDGLFPPGSTAHRDTISLYSTDLCRQLFFSKDKKEHSEQFSIHGIPVEKFELSPTNFANGTVCRENSCYNNNLPTGVQNVTTCKRKSPAYISRPHFHLADPIYQDQFQFGVTPRVGDHDSTFWIEPLSSIPLKVEMRMQLNVLLDKIEGIDYLFKDMPRVMFPVFWFDSHLEIPQQMAAQLQLLVMLPNMMVGSGYFSIGTSFLIIIYIFFSKLRRSDNGSDKKTQDLDLESPKVKLPKNYAIVPTEEFLPQKDCIIS